LATGTFDQSIVAGSAANVDVHASADKANANAVFFMLFSRLKF
jgi:hypothetical protein